jgi:hypothetical protein
MRNSWADRVKCVSRSMLVVVGAALVAALAAGPAASRPRPHRPEPAAAAAPADDLSQRLQRAAEPYVGGTDGEPGWRFASPPAASRTADGSIVVRAEQVSYVVSPAATIDFDAIEAKAVADGDNYVVSLTFAGEPQLRGADGVLAHASLGEYKITGRWDPRRAAFQTLDARFSGLRLALANGMTVTVERLAGQFSSAAAEALDRTARMDGTLTADGLQSKSGDGRWWGTVGRAKLGLGLKDLDKAASLHIDFEHSLPAGHFLGVMGEVVPLQLALAATVQPFPWQAFLRDLPATTLAVAGKAGATPSQLWSLSWARLSAVLAGSGAEVAVTQLSGHTVGLEFGGQGRLSFQPGHEPQGRFNGDLKGINERIAALTPAERKDDQMLFPSLALMTVVGNGVTKNGKRFHRYAVEFGDGGIRVNGRDVASLKPTP